MIQLHRLAKPLGSCAFAALLALRALTAGAAPQDEIRAAVDLVDRTYYEGFPAERAESLSPAATGQLAAMLADPAERVHAANIAIALGVAAQPGAYEALESAAEVRVSGEIDRASFRMLDAIPSAMGYLARSDERAWQWLVQRARTRGTAPAWSHGSLAGQELADHQRRRAIAGLALSRRSEVPALLDSIASEGARARSSVAPDPELRAAIDTARRIRERAAASGSAPRN